MAMRLLGTVVAAGLAASGMLAVPGSAQAQDDPPVIGNATDPSLTPFGSRGVLLVAHGAVSADGVIPPDAVSAPLVTRSGRDVGGRLVWGPTVRIGQASLMGVRAVALNRHGVGAVLWSSQIGNRGRTYLRLRRADGSWAPTHRIAHAGFNYDGMADVAVNAHGMVVALTTRGFQASFLTVHRPHGHWQRMRLPRHFLNPQSVSVDDHGGIHAIETSVPRGGDGLVFTGYRSPRGRWSSGRAKVGAMVEDGQLYVASSGAQTLVVGRASRKWKSTGDTEYYWPTQYTVLRRSHPTGRWHQIWHRMGATDMTAVASGPHLRLLWTQYAKPNAHRSPQVLRLQSQGTAAGSIRTTLASEPTLNRFDEADFTYALSASGTCRVQIWRPDAADTTSGGQLTSLAGGRRTTYADQTTARYDLQAASACLGDGHGFVARTANQRVDVEVDGQYVVGGDVVVTRAR